MARVTPKEFQEKHARRLKGALEDMRIGVERTTTAPGEQAAKKVEKMKAKLLEKIEDGTWARRTAAVSLEDWKKKMIEKGIARVSGGVDAAAEKTENFAAQLLPHIDSVVADVEKMPDLTIEDSIARMTKFVRGMSKFTKK